MSKKKNSNAITRVNPTTTAITAPGYMQDAPLGIEELLQYVRPPRLKVIQKQAEAATLDRFGIGDVVLMPQGIVVAAMKHDDKGRPTGEATPFLFAPVFFYAEYCKWNPIELKGQGPSVVERTFDPASPLAARCRDVQQRFEPIPGKEKEGLKYRYVEHLNYVCVFVGDGAPLAGEAFIMTFARGEMRAGGQLASLVKMRRAPLYGCVFEARAAFRSNAKGDWYGIDCINPPADTSPWATAEQFETFKRLHGEFAELHKKACIRVDYDSGPDSDEDKEDKDAY